MAAALVDLAGKPKMGHSNTWNSHPKNYGPGSRTWLTGQNSCSSILAKLVKANWTEQPRCRRYRIQSTRMSENPLQLLFQTFGKISASVQTHIAHFISPHSPSLTTDHAPLISLSPHSNFNSHPVQPAEILSKGTSSGPITREDLGRATWTFLHTLAAQYPEKPTRQQKRDVKELMTILSRMYPCKECADHFKEVLRANPVQAGSQHEFSQWMCHVHNVVNRSLGKVIFPCERVDARWGKLECENRACDLQGSSMDFGDEFFK